MRTLKFTLGAASLLLAAATCLHAQIPAFPGAEGFGAYANGGRGGDVYTVVNLNSSGAGSLRYGVETAPSQGRTIVFAVSGYIPISYNGDTGNQTVRIVQNKVRIAGQTAPGDGIALKDGRILITGDNVVIQHLRIRHGKNGGAGDCLNIDRGVNADGVTNVMLDHISMAFSTDENISSFEQNPRVDLMTLQWSLNAWGLESHSAGGLWDVQRVTTHHTLWSHNHTRNPKARPYGLLDWINNVTYDWDIGFIMGDSTTPAPWKANVRGNYFVCPPGNLRSVALEKASIDRNGNKNFTLHVSTNLFDKDGDTLLDGLDYGYGIASGSYQVSNAPIVVAGAQVPVAMDLPLTAYKKIVSRAGPLRLDALANIPLRDELDTILVSNLVTLKRHHVSHENQTGASNNGLGFLNSTPAPADSDLDGMPDVWEQTLGWNSGSQDHNTAIPSSGGLITGLTFFPPNTPAGYTRLEEYLHFLAIPHATISKNTAEGASSFSSDLRKFTSGFNKAPVVFTLSNVTNGTAVIQPDGYTVVFTPTLDFSGRAKFDFMVTDGDGSTWTQTLAVLVSSVGVPRDLKWKGDGSANQWNTNAANFLNGTNLTAFAPGDNVRFDDTGFNTPDINLGLTLLPGVVEVNAAQNYTLGGSGALGGAAQVVKNGPGNLVLGTANSFSGGLELNAGNVTLANSTTAAGGGTINFNGGSLTLTAPGGPAVYNNPVVMTEPGTLFTPGSGNANQALGGPITGSAILSINTAGSGTFSARSGMTLSGYSGTLQLTGTGYFRWQGGTGSSTTAFDLGNSTAVMFVRDGGTVTLGSLTGGQGTTLRGAGSMANATTYLIGQKGGSTFDGTITDGNVSGNPVACAITKLGSSTLTLTGTNTHTGTTTVSAGTLLVNGSHTASPVTVSSGGTLGGTGTIGGLITVNSGGKLAPGANAEGMLAATGGVTLNTPTMQFDLSSSPAGNNDKLQMQGGLLTMSGTQNYQFNLLDGHLNAGTYTLIDGGDNTSAAGVGLSHNLPADGRQMFLLQRPASGDGQCYVQLVVTGNPTTLVWRGLANNNWDTTAINWLNGAVPDKFYNFDSVVIDDTSASAPTINLIAAVNPASILVNASGNRTFSGTASLTGYGTLTKTGAGTLNIVNSNGTFSGHVMLTGGALTLGVAGATFGTGPLTLGGGATFNMPPTAIKYTHSAPITVLPGQSGTIYSPGLFSEIFSSFISGSTNSVLNISGGVSIGGTTASQFDNYFGAIHIQPGATLRFSANSSGNTYGSLNPTFIIDGALRPRNAGNTIRLGALSGAGSIEGPQSNGGSGDTTYIIGGNNTDVTFNGVISSNSAVAGSLVVLNKIGTGKLTLGGNNIYAGGTTVTGGILMINNTTGSGTGTGDLSIAGGATLGGTGIIGSDTTLDDFAVLAPGNSTGTLTFNNSLTLGEFSVLNFELGASSDSVAANGALTLQGTLNVIPVADFGAGTYTLFTYNPAQTFNYSGLTLGAVPDGFNFAINTNTPGQVNLIVSLPTPPSFGQTVLSGGNLIMTGSGGTPDADYYLLTSTNVALPLAQWTRSATNQFDSEGNFAVTNSVTSQPRQFFRVQVAP